jgi:hypothetical protein
MKTVCLYSLNDQSEYPDYIIARWGNEEVPLAEALKTDLPRSIGLGFKMVRTQNHKMNVQVAGLSLCVEISR